MKYCDNCGKSISKIRGIRDEENIWINEYKKRKKKLKGFRGWFKGVNMPIYYNHGIDFCDEKCYEEWKELFKIKCDKAKEERE